MYPLPHFPFIVHSQMGISITELWNHLPILWGGEEFQCYMFLSKKRLSRVVFLLACFSWPMVLSIIFHGIHVHLDTSLFSFIPQINVLTTQFWNESQRFLQVMGFGGLGIPLMVSLSVLSEFCPRSVYDVIITQQKDCYCKVRFTLF